MTGDEMQAVSDAEELGWLRSRSDDDHLCGFDASGWASSVWILHAMYINRDLPADVTYDTLHKAAPRPGPNTLRRWWSRQRTQPTIDRILAGSTATGIPLGYTTIPEPPWERLTWRSLADELQLVLGDVDVPPCFRWFPLKSWPARILPPPEGSLDGLSLERLLAHLGSHSEAGLATEVFAYYAPLTSGDFDHPTLLVGPLGSIPALTQGRDREFTPSNIWPRDRSWIVYTDYDLEGTKVSGDRVPRSGVGRR